jgi:capsule polysaccharide export protein KpsE/RkpR|tara:strand:+ start:125 stop:445 length:321 start_codon:yes stop_codon:yes gene_type:complete
MTNEDAFETQVGGNHYMDMAIQPLEYIMANNMSYCEANVVKYISRWRSKNGLEDLRKAKHYIELLIQAEYDVHETSKSLGELLDEDYQLDKLKPTFSANKPIEGNR